MPTKFHRSASSLQVIMPTDNVSFKVSVDFMLDISFEIGKLMTTSGITESAIILKLL